MNALISLIFFALVVEQISARDSRLSRDCLNGVKNRFKCCKGVPNAWYAHMKNPKDCGTFYQCDNGEPVLRECPKGLKWSVAADRCEHPKYARCNSNNYDSSEESGEINPLLPNKCYNGKLSAKKCCKGISAWWVHLPDPEDCTKFYHCDNGKAVHKDCPANLHWSVAANKCDWPHVAGCQGVQPTVHPTEATEKPTEPATKPTEPTKQPTKEPIVLPGGCYNGSISAKICCEGVSDWWVHLPDPEHCGKFYQCDNDQAVHKDCPAGLHWSVVADKCEWPGIAGCQTSPTGKPTIEPTEGPTKEPTEGPTSTQKPVLPGGCYNGNISADVCCKGVSDWWVHLPDPKNCGKFYQCDNGQAVHKDCPAGLHWSVTADRCEWPEIAGCQTSSTDKPTEGPTNGPTEEPTNGPTEGPTNGPTNRPTNGPTEGPTNGPTNRPTNGPTEGPTNGPTEGPTNRPTEGPTNGPTNRPTNRPTEEPTSTQKPVLPGGCYDGSINAKVCCEGVSDWWVHLPDPENCGKFYQCDNGQAVHKDCPAGLHWSVTADRCEWPEIAGCQISSTGKPTDGPTNRPTEGPTNGFTNRPTNRPTEGPTSGPTNKPTNGPTEGPISTQKPVLPGGCYDGSINAKVCCEGVSDWWVHLPDPENCGKFYQCDNGQAVHKDCPAGLHWSVAADRCEWPEIAGCQISSTSKPTDGPTNRPTEGPTNGFTNRPTNRPTEGPTSGPTNKPTNGPTEGPISTQKPVLPGGCYDGSINAKVCCEGVSDWWVHLPDPENCGKFYQCDNGQAVHKDCPAGLHWSVAADRCEWPEIAGCQISSTGKPTDGPTNRPTEGPTNGSTNRPTNGPTKGPTSGLTEGPTSGPTNRPTSGPTEGPSSTQKPVLPGGCYEGSISAEVCCEGVNDWWVHLPDPENCGKFYQCDNGQAVHKDCPAGLHWSVVADRCEWHEIAGCQTSPTGKPTDEPAKESTEGPTKEPTERPTSGPTNRPTNGPTEGPISTQKPVLPGGCYDGIINAKVCCEGVSDWWVHLPDPENCGKFYQCHNGQAVHKDCPAGLHWSVTADRCEWHEIAGCQTSPTGKPTDEPAKEPTEGPTSGPTNKPTNGPTEGPISTQKPVLPGGCYDGSISAKVCCEGVSDWWVHLPDPENCGKFYQCDNGQAVHKDCPAGLHWSVTADRCEWHEIAGCQTSPTGKPTDEPANEPTNRPTNGPTEGPTSSQKPVVPGGCFDGSISANVCCEGVSDWWVHLPDPENCGKFYQCDNGQAVHKDCPAGLHWSVTADRCEWHEIAGCQTSPTGKPTDEPINKPTEEPTNGSTEEPTNAPTNGPTNGSTDGPTEEDICSPTPVFHQCYTGVFSAEFCCEGIKNWQKVHLAHPQDCTSYYDCVNEAAILRKCPEGLHWSIKTDRCEWPINAHCSNYTGNGNGNESAGSNEEEVGNDNSSISEGCLYGEIDPNTCCETVPETVDVLLQNNNNCHSYYQCVHGKPKIRPCPAGLWWSVNRNRCEWRRNATCTWETEY